MLVPHLIFKLRPIAPLDGFNANVGSVTIDLFNCWNEVRVN